MTPDLTTTQTIGFASAIVGFCLTVFFTTLIVLTYGHRIRQYLRQRGLLVQPRPRTPAHLPFHYVLPFQLLEPPRGQLADLAPHERQAETPGPARRRPTTYVASSSEELLQNREEPGPQNATPGPSNVPRTPTPEPNDRNVLARYQWTHEHPSPPTPNLVYRSGLWYRTDIAPGWNIPVPSPYPLTTSSTNYSLNSPTPVPAPRTPPTNVPTPQNTSTLSPFADESEDSDPPVRIRRGSDPLNPHTPDYDWPNLSQVDREIFGPERVRAWELRQRDVDRRMEGRGRDSRPRQSMDRFLATHRGDPLVGTSLEAQITARIFANRDRAQFGPVFGGDRLDNLQPRTPYEQRLLENQLRALSILFRDRLIAEGDHERAEAVYVR